MRLLSALLIALLFASASAHAETIVNLAKKSDFIRIHNKELQRNRAKSAYVGTKPYCPSIYWWSNRPSANDNAKTGYGKTITRLMKQAGFPARSITHCVQNSGFVFKGGEVQSHPKNRNYRRYVQAGVMVYSAKGKAAQTLPVLVETNTYGKRRWVIYDASFKELCVLANASSGLTLSCRGIGKTRVTSQQAKNRTTITSRGNGPKIMMMTRRPPSFVKQAFNKAF